jgi:hypothetical protein
MKKTLRVDFEVEGDPLNRVVPVCDPRVGKAQTAASLRGCVMPAEPNRALHHA